MTPASQKIVSKASKMGALKATDGLLESDGPSAYLDQVFVTIKPKKQEASGVNPNPKLPVVADPDSEIQALIIQNPNMNANTFFNLLKSKGLIGKPAAAGPTGNAEADSTSTVPQVTRAGVKESNMIIRQSARFLEGATPKDKSAGFTKYRSVLIQEGMGNFGDAYFYTKAALQSAVPLFEGKKIYADHPDAMEEETRPERSVRDILGHFENVTLETNDQGQAEIHADVCMMEGDNYRWARDLMVHAVAFAVKFPDKEFVGLSINAGGESEAVPLASVLESEIPQSIKLKLQEAQLEGIETLKLVTKITSAVSCDLVTEAGAGGKILELLEGAKNMAKAKAKIKEDGGSLPPKSAKDQKEADSNDGLDQAGGAQDPAADTDDQADHDQDVALIKQMLDKYVGQDSGKEATHEEAGIVKEAFDMISAKKGEDGKPVHSEEEAVKLANAHLQMCKEMAEHKAQKEAGAAPAPSGKGADASDKPAPAAKDGKGDAGADDSAEAEESEEADESKEKKESKEHKESALRAENLKLKGELASFKEGQRKAGLRSHIEKVCKESKLSNKVTEIFKEGAKDCKSVEEVNKAWKLFEAGYKSNKGSLEFDSLTIETESVSFNEAAGAGKIDFANLEIED